MDESSGLVVFISFADAESAHAVGRSLVTDELAACVHVLPGIAAVYRWQGAVEEDPQTLLICKTTEEAWPRLLARAHDLHSDVVPEIIALPIVKGLPAYLAWMRDVVPG